MALSDELQNLNTAIAAVGTALEGKVGNLGTMAERNLLTGTADPTNAQGVDGDIYLKTEG